MRRRFGRRRIFGAGSVVWLGIGVLVILALLTGRHEKTANAIRAAYSTARDRLGRRDQPAQPNADFRDEQAGEFRVQENSEEETEGSTAEVEEDPGEETKGITKESARRSEEGDGREEESQGGKSVADVEEGPDAVGLPIEEYDSLSVSQITQRLRELSLEEVEQLRDYEAENRNRRSIMQRFETKIRAARKNLEKRGDAETEESSGE
jgi:hypothetical protein